MAIRPILLLGNPVLRANCVPVKRAALQSTSGIIEDLRDTLIDFRRRNGFGRGIAAPQIGAAKQIIFIEFEYSGPLINPKVVKRSRKKFQLWDDCFSFPELLVKVERNFAVTVEFLNAEGKSVAIHAEGALSELLQHEIDHVNGILAIDRAIDSKHIVLRSEYEKLKTDNTRIL
jgi:peptide deformylase